MPRPHRPVRSAARMVVPLPQNGSRTMSPWWVTSRDRIGNHRNRLDSRMDIETARSTSLRETVHAREVPDVGAIAAENPELDVVLMSRTTFTEDEDELVARAV